ncbi:93a56c32-5b62-4c2f-ab49-5d9240287574 [Thermothielavioides terrestris]|uniref:93a56c32-5b62-4c2f-ab49-5d9240287574 n=1 Tax=Thermothielavioides terrestris TaxID=2587410 RepID=A0A3S4EVD2_9PEZI|nr:93a56c32-5b62-4c2f-ab49-5d9240287574 [Thermothielavioides terrestris]
MPLENNESPTGLEGEASPVLSPSRHPSISLQATAAMNASLQRSSNSPLSPRNRSPSSDRRRSQVLMNLHIADPSVPAPGEMVSDGPQGTNRTSSPRTVSASPRLIASWGPRHDRVPSLGELHQELENEQEYQVNRLLVEIRRLQEQLQRQQQQAESRSTTASGDEASDRPAPLPILSSSPQPAYPSSGSLPRSPVFPRSSFDMARADIRHRSRTPSRNASPRMRSTSVSADSAEPFSLGGRDESAFYQAESQMLIRENQMLRHRIRELERQLSELQGTSASLTHEPSHASHLGRSVSVSEDESAKQTPTDTSQSSTGKEE